MRIRYFAWIKDITNKDDDITPSSFQFCFYYLAKIKNAGANTKTSDIVNIFYPCMMSGLANYLIKKY